MDRDDRIITNYNYLPFKTKWAMFYTYILIPAYALVLAMQIILFLRDISYIDLYKIHLIINLSMLAVTICAVIFMMKFKKSGYYLNIFLLILQCASYAYFKSAKADMFDVKFLENFTFALALWAIPNIVYFYFRKGAFFNTIKIGLLSEAKINKKAELYVMLNVYSKTYTPVYGILKIFTRIADFIRLINFDSCMYNINLLGFSNKFLKFYLFYFMPATIFLIVTKTYNTHSENYAAAALNMVYIISYIYMLKLRKCGLYLNSAFIILYIIYIIYACQNSYYSLPSELCYAYITALIVFGAFTVIYCFKRKE
ncbi:MAG: hypothetical protein AAGU14_08770, partial [Eubacteriaceae bacterium]